MEAKKIYPFSLTMKMLILAGNEEQANEKYKEIINQLESGEGITELSELGRVEHCEVEENELDTFDTLLRRLSMCLGTDGYWLEAYAMIASFFKLPGLQSHFMELYNKEAQEGGMLTEEEGVLHDKLLKVLSNFIKATDKEKHKVLTKTLKNLDYYGDFKW